jgi:hypothetical protein
VQSTSDENYYKIPFVIVTPPGFNETLRVKGIEEGNPYFGLTFSVPTILC